METELREQVALVTGASRGIGRAIALALAAEGCPVGLVARGRDQLGQVSAEIAARGGRALVVGLDLAASDAAQRAVSEVEQQLGPVTVLVSNLGGRSGAPGSQVSGEEWSSTLDLNAGLALRLAQAAIPGMKRAGWGRIVNISSIYGREAGGAAAYNAGKAALISLTKSLARELAPHGITVNSVAPGSILFPGGSWDRRQREEPERVERMLRHDLPLGRFGTPEEVAAAVVFLCSRGASLVTGATLPVDGGQGWSNI